MLRVLTDRVDRMQEQMGNVSRNIEILRKNQKEMLEINAVIEINNAFDGLISRLDITEEIISKLKDSQWKVSRKISMKT